MAYTLDISITKDRFVNVSYFVVNNIILSTQQKAFYFDLLAEDTRGYFYVCSFLSQYRI